MSFEPLRDIIPIVRPGKLDEVVRQWVERYHEERPAAPVPQWVVWHFESVAEFNAWKPLHPHDGMLTVTHRWAPIILGIVSALTFSPVGLALAVSMQMAQEGRRASH